MYEIKFGSEPPINFVVLLNGAREVREGVGEVIMTTIKLKDRYPSDS